MYDDTRKAGFILADDQGIDWLGDRGRYQTAVSSETASEPATYDTADAPEDSAFDGCNGYVAIVSEDGISGGLWSGTSDDARSASDDSP
ncbi:hypothetical protein ACFQMA_09090 [Halosimplex aquaticum]|uniref:Uncharacterized protein n=1 Tax=Halosimplex aquaticum TaxID=3026162 RepID=A0ABD5XXY0_9EURY